MERIVILIVLGLVILLALPPFLDGAVRKKSTRKSVKMLCKIFGWLFLIWGAYKAIVTLFGI